MSMKVKANINDVEINDIEITNPDELLNTYAKFLEVAVLHPITIDVNEYVSYASDLKFPGHKDTQEEAENSSNIYLLQLSHGSKYIGVSSNMYLDVKKEKNNYRVIVYDKLDDNNIRATEILANMGYKTNFFTKQVYRDKFNVKFNSIKTTTINKDKHKALFDKVVEHKTHCDENREKYIKMSKKAREENNKRIDDEERRKYFGNYGSF